MITSQAERKTPVTAGGGPAQGAPDERKAAISLIFIHTDLTGTPVHRSKIFSKLFPYPEIHVEVPERGDGADLHGSCGRVVGDLLGGLQQTHDLPQRKANI